MTEITDRLEDLGFVVELTGNPNWPDKIYKWETDQERYGSRRVWITSHSNWHFQIERAFQGYETGIEGYSRYRAFRGYASSWDEFKVLMKCTGVFNDITEPNVLKNV